MRETQIPEEYVTLVRVLVEDSQLKEWFGALASLPENRRYSELGRIASMFRNDGQDNLADMIMSLYESRIYTMIKEVADAHG